MRSIFFDVVESDFGLLIYLPPDNSRSDVAFISVRIFSKSSGFVSGGAAELQPMTDSSAMASKVRVNLLDSFGNGGILSLLN